MEQAIRGKSSAVPRLKFEGARCDNAILPGVRSAIAALYPEELAANVIVPVQRIYDETKLRQMTEPTWDRHLVSHFEQGNPSFFPPLLLSSRDKWHLGEQFIEVFDRAVLIDGAKRLEAALQFQSKYLLPVIILFGLEPAAELQLRNHICSVNPTTYRVQERERCGTTAPRLKVREKWIDLEIQSDPFVVATARGYAPVIIVRRDNAPHAEHLMIGAASLAKELEGIRVKYGTLKDRRISVRKQGPDKTAPYDVRSLT
jgi:hypothetical protein